MVLTLITEITGPLQPFVRGPTHAVLRLTQHEGPLSEAVVFACVLYYCTHIANGNTSNIRHCGVQECGYICIQKERKEAIISANSTPIGSSRNIAEIGFTTAVMHSLTQGRANIVTRSDLK